MTLRLRPLLHFSDLICQRSTWQLSWTDIIIAGSQTFWDPRENVFQSTPCGLNVTADVDFKNCQERFIMLQYIHIALQEVYSIKNKNLYENKDVFCRDTNFKNIPQDWSSIFFKENKNLQEQIFYQSKNSAFWGIFMFWWKQNLICTSLKYKIKISQPYKVNVNFFHDKKSM